MVKRPKYDERLFSLMARRADLVGRINADGVLLNEEGLSQLNGQILSRAKRWRGLPEELMTEMAENMPEMVLSYDLAEKPIDTRLRSGVQIKEAIRLARVARDVGYDFRVFGGFRGVIDDYLEDVAKPVRMDDLETDGIRWENFKQDLQSVVDVFYEQVSKDLGKKITVKDHHYNGPLPGLLTSAITHMGRVPIPGHGLRMRNLSLLDQILVPEAEYDFAGPHDSWRLFRETYLGESENRFGLVYLDSSGMYDLHIVNHNDTNTLTKIRELNRTSAEGETKAFRLDDILDDFSKIVSGDGDWAHTKIFSVDPEVYARQKVEWYHDLIKRFGSVSTIRSMHNDDTLHLRKYELPKGRDFAAQNLESDSVNLHLRKILTMGRMLGGYDMVLPDAYGLTQPVINNYRREAFESNNGVMVSDISIFPEAHDWLFIPTYLNPSEFPSIGVSRGSVYMGSDTVNIAVRSPNVWSAVGVKDSIRSTFGEVEYEF